MRPKTSQERIAVMVRDLIEWLEKLPDERQDEVLEAIMKHDIDIWKAMTERELM